mmetsp:Transcript_31622/g.82527  ORF Transcript_31622/g.82527 Transcript_31622/m.82527 type:complete len:129 (-) Transcript_31622:68-454(-)
MSSAQTAFEMRGGVGTDRVGVLHLHHDVEEMKGATATTIGGGTIVMTVEKGVDMKRGERGGERREKRERKGGMPTADGGGEARVKERRRRERRKGGEEIDVRGVMRGEEEVRRGRKERREGGIGEEER